MAVPYIVCLSGSPSRPSKTSALVGMIAADVVSRTTARLDVFDLVDAGPGLGSALRRKDLTPSATRIIDAIEQADALIVGTPVYKGGYTGLFKHVFDLIDPQALVGKPVLITATGGGPRHALVVEHALRPLFGFFEALTIPTAVYASEVDFSNGALTDPGVIARAGTAARQLEEILNVRGLRASATSQQSPTERWVVPRKAAVG
jgi:FMN reductase